MMQKTIRMRQIEVVVSVGELLEDLEIVGLDVLLQHRRGAGQSRHPP